MAIGDKDGGGLSGLGEEEGGEGKGVEDWDFEC